MKLVHEYINEKFKEDSDPIEDLGIGIFTNRYFKTRHEMYEWLSNNLVYILGSDNKLDDILKDILDMPGYGGSFLGTKYTEKLNDFVKKYMHILGENPTYIHPDPFHWFLKRKYPHIRSWQVEGNGYYAGKKETI